MLVFGKVESCFGEAAEMFKEVSASFRVESYTSENGDLWRKVENLETANR